MSRKFMAIPFIALFLLSGCSMVSVEGKPLGTETKSTSTPTPVEIVLPDPTKTPTPTPEPVFVSKYEFLGEGSGYITYVDGAGGMIQRQVQLPYEVVVSSGPYNNSLADGYVFAATSYTYNGQSLGCRITVNNSVVREILPVEGQISAMCVRY